MTLRPAELRLHQKTRQVSQELLTPQPTKGCFVETFVAMTLNWFFIACLLSSPLLTLAQSGTITPTRPAQPDTIILRYTVGPQSALDGSEPIYARLTTYLMDGAVNKSHVLLPGPQATRLVSLQLPPQAASFKVDFYTLNKEDNKESQTRLVYEATRQRPVRSAYLESMFTEKPTPVFQQEIALYPDNYLAYARYFNVLAMVSDADTAQRTIQRVLPTLERVAIKSAGLLSALCVGYAKTGQLARAKTNLVNLFARFPLAAETAFAFSIYNYEAYKASGQDVEPDIRQRLKELFIQYPGGAIARSENVFHYLQGETDIPLVAFERVMKPLYKTDQVSYYAFTNLPELYLLRQQQLDSARILLQNGINRYQDGTIQHQYRLTNSHYQLYVPYMLLTLAKIDLLAKTPQQAIGHASTGIALLAGSNTEGNFMPQLLAVRAAAYQQAGNLNLALEDYKRGYKLGQMTALDSIRRLFSRCQVKQQTVEALIASLQTGAATPSTTSQPLMPVFVGTNLAGKKVSLQDFKNKVVVINVWGVGCGPCVAEMPRLNELVQQYANQPDVVFLGVTGDAPLVLQKFLKKRPFAYRILTNVSNLSETFNTNALPVHIVVGRQGEVINRSIGARADIGSYLSQLIDRALQ